MSENVRYFRRTKMSVLAVTAKERRDRALQDVGDRKAFTIPIHEQGVTAPLLNYRECWIT